MGFMGVFRQPLDIFNSPTPILILAIAAGHAVQLLKRYYEEYAALVDAGRLSPKEANREAVVRSLVGVGPVMLIAGGVAALGRAEAQIAVATLLRRFPALHRRPGATRIDSATIRGFLHLPLAAG